jgi:hypothetical protein
VIEPLLVIDQADQRLLSGCIGQQAQHGQADQEPVRGRPGAEAERRLQRRTLWPLADASAPRPASAFSSRGTASPLSAQPGRANKTAATRNREEPNAIPRAWPRHLMR